MLKVCSKTDIGRKRSINQDCVYSCSVPIGNLSNLFIVADGMGGHKAGDYASAYTVNCIEREVIITTILGAVYFGQKKIVKRSISPIMLIVISALLGMVGYAL